MSLSVRPLTGPEIAAAIDDLAALRIAVFAAFPYLYDGAAAYEADYLREGGQMFIAAEIGDIAIEGGGLVGFAQLS